MEDEQNECFPASYVFFSIYFFKTFLKRKSAVQCVRKITRARTCFLKSHYIVYDCVYFFFYFFSKPWCTCKPPCPDCFILTHAPSHFNYIVWEYISVEIRLNVKKTSWMNGFEKIGAVCKTCDCTQSKTLKRLIFFLVKSTKFYNLIWWNELRFTLML